jgi:hypothetical protein
VSFKYFTGLTARNLLVISRIDLYGPPYEDAKLRTGLLKTPYSAFAKTLRKSALILPDATAKRASNFVYASSKTISP